MENTKKAVIEFERRVYTEVRKQEKLNIVKERDFRRGEYQDRGSWTWFILFFLFIFYFLFDLFFYFLFLEQIWLGLIGHAVTSVTT